MSISESEISSKIANLTQIGWTLLDEKCPLESCDCILLKSLDGNKYCVKCEMWQFPDKVRSKQKYTDLVVKAHQELALKELGIAKINKGMKFYMYDKMNVINSLRMKLAQLTIQLNDELDQEKTNLILRNIELCIKNIKSLNDSI